MATSFPGAVKNFSAIVNGVTKLVAALFNSPYDEITAIETALLATIIHTDGTIKPASVNTIALKTTTGEVSTTDYVGTTLTLPGGEYGFYPQVKGDIAATADHIANIGGHRYNIAAWALTTSYATYISLGRSGATTTIYAQQRYVTASGKDHWIFLLIDKTTKEIISAYSAPDHPAYGNGGDFDRVSHPFGSYDATKHEIVLVDNDTITELKAQVTQEKSLLTLVNEEYKPNMAKEEIYKPLHSGRFIDKKPELVQTIPAYINVRKLIKLTQPDKDTREVLHQQKILETQEKKRIEDLIEAKKREIAIAKLKEEGKL